MNRIAKSAVIVASSVCTLLVSSPAALASQPAVNGCVGASISGAAHAIQPYGQFVSQFARDAQSHPGVSDDVHTLAAGGFTDAQFPNSCN